MRAMRPICDRRESRRVMAIAAALSAGAFLAVAPDARPDERGRVVAAWRTSVGAAAPMVRVLAGFAFGLMAIAAWLQWDRRRQQMIHLAIRPAARLRGARRSSPLVRTAWMHSLRRGGRVGP